MSSMPPPVMFQRPVRRQPTQVSLDRAPAQDILERLRECEFLHPRPELIRAAGDYLEGALLEAYHADRART